VLLRRLETDFKFQSIESLKNRGVLIVRMKTVYDVEGRPIKDVYEILTRRIENLNQVLKD